LFRLLFDHYLSAEHVTHQENKVEARIAGLSYKGEQKNWGWDKYVDAHIEQHIIAKNLMPYGYSGIGERSKIRHLLGGISNPGLHPVTCNILAMKEEDKTFTKCATMYTDFIRTCGNSVNPRQDRNGHQISSVLNGRGGGRGRGGGGRGDGRGRGEGRRGGGRSAGVPDQADVDKVNWLQANKYHTAKEYVNFNPAEKAWIHQNCTEGKEKSPKRKVAAVRRGNGSAMDMSDDDKSLFGDDDESVSSKKSNAKNPALARQQGKKPKNRLPWADSDSCMTRESRQIAPLRTVRLTRPLVRMAKFASNSILETSLELDSHADTTVLGGDALIFQNYDRPVEVLGYDPTMGDLSNSERCACF
jgi:hypothetical protein